MMDIRAELEREAVEHDADPLIILGYQVDKTNAREVYGALCWIEKQLLAVQQMGRVITVIPDA